MDIALEIAVARLTLSDRLAADPADRWLIRRARPVDAEVTLVTGAVCNDLTADVPHHQPRPPTPLRAPMIFLGMGHGQCSYPARRPVRWQELCRTLIAARKQPKQRGRGGRTWLVGRDCRVRPYRKSAARRAGYDFGIACFRTRHSSAQAT
jgi:hypothetical protein